MTHDVFISHSSKDKQAADAICHALEKNGIKCWIAPRDVKPGFEYAEELINGIKNSRVFLLIFSKESNTSKPVSKEIESAFRYEKTVIPYRIEDVEMRESLEYYLSNLHWLDAFPSDNEFDSLVQAVKNALGTREDTASAPMPAPAPAPMASMPVPVPLPKKSNTKLIAIIALAAAVVIAAAVGITALVLRDSDSVPAGGGETVRAGERERDRDRDREQDIVTNNGTDVENPVVISTAEVQLLILGKWSWTVIEGDMLGSTGFSENFADGEFYTFGDGWYAAEWGAYHLDGLNITLNFTEGGEIQRGVIEIIDDNNFTITYSGLYSNYVCHYVRTWVMPNIPNLPDLPDPLEPPVYLTWQEAYADYLENTLGEFFLDFSIDTVLVKDINNDGIPEIFLFCDWDLFNTILTFAGGRVTELEMTLFHWETEFYFIPETGQIVERAARLQGPFCIFEHVVHEITPSGFSEAIWIRGCYDMDGEVCEEDCNIYEINDGRVSREEYQTAFDRYIRPYELQEIRELMLEGSFEERMGYLEEMLFS